jgi:hypothetical protein
MTITTDLAALPAQAGRTGVLAQVDMYFEEHPEGRPALSAVLSLNAKGTVAQRVAYVEQIAAWLGVTVTERYGTRFAQRLFTDERGDRLIIEAHVTPDRDAAYHAIVQAATGAHARPEDEPEQDGGAGDEAREDAAA